MGIVEGLGALKTGFDIANSINQRVKEGKLYPNEIADQLLRLQQAMIDSQRALMDAENEIKALKEKIAADNQTKQVDQDLEWVEDGGFFISKTDKSLGKLIRYCPLCWRTTNKLVPLNPQSGHGHFRCDIHHSNHETQAYRDHLRDVNSRARISVRNQWG